MLPPGPRTPALWQTFRFVTDPEAYARRMQMKYGDAVTIKTLLGDGVAVYDPAIAREVFAAAPDTFETLPLVEAFFGRSAVIAVSGAQHKKLRKLLNPRFQGTHVRAFLVAMQRAIDAHVDRLAARAGTGEVVALAEVTQALALDVIVETVFGGGDIDRPRAREVLVEMVHGVSPAIIGGTTFHKPWYPPWRRFVRARAAFDSWAYDVIRARRAGEPSEDVLGVLLSARYDDGSAMTDEEVRDQLFTLLLAGHETSAIAMAWCVYHLARSPAALERVRAELASLGPTPAPEAITKARFLDACVSEALRIEPIVTDVVRICREPFTLGGGRWRLDEGHVVAVMIVSILKDPRVFPDPDAFRPERFLESSFGPSEFLPFGGGARRCLGAAFAQAELALGVAALVTRLDLELADAAPERAVRRNLTMGPKRGVRVRVRAVRPARGASSPRVSAV